jgi:hypothetical protein
MTPARASDGIRVAPLGNLSDRTVKMFEDTLNRFRDFLGHEPTVDRAETTCTAAKFLRWRGSTVHAPASGSSRRPASPKIPHT